MAQASLKDLKYRHPPRAHGALVVKRKSSALYKCRLCARGDVAPLSAEGFTGSPTCLRPAVKIIAIISASTGWNLRALSISQAALQSANSKAQDRIVALHHPTAAAPCSGNPPPMGADLKSLRHPIRGRGPLYERRDAPERRFFALYRRIRSRGRHPMKSDICMFANHDSHRNLYPWRTPPVRYPNLLSILESRSASITRPTQPSSIIRLSPFSDFEAFVRRPLCRDPSAAAP